jgi:hypothetical protein
MAQLTLRVEEALARRLKAVAGERGESVNAYASSVLAAAVDPDTAGTEVERLRERLARAGLVAASATRGRHPPEVELARARSAAGTGRELSDLVSEDRR